MEEQDAMSQHSAHSLGPSFSLLCFISKSHSSYLHPASCSAPNLNASGLLRLSKTFQPTQTSTTSTAQHSVIRTGRANPGSSHISSALATNSKSWKYTDVQFRACRHNNLPTDITLLQLRCEHFAT